MRNTFAFFFIIGIPQTAWYDRHPVKSDEFPFKVDIAINLQDQAYLQPHPKELMLRNHV